MSVGTCEELNLRGTAGGKVKGWSEVEQRRGTLVVLASGTAAGCRTSARAAIEASTYPDPSVSMSPHGSDSGALGSAGTG